MKNSKWMVSALCLGLAGAGQTFAETGRPVTESDFLTDMPIVLSVSRLSQRLDETPGAVTVLDRNMIRLSGARDVADLLRLVPGFQSTMSFERIAPQATYHGTYYSVSNRMQVLVDGRSVYSPFLVGGIGPGLQTVALADIERIEVLRGSNSAAYGARAFLGVINIITLDPNQTVGFNAGASQGTTPSMTPVRVLAPLRTTHAFACQWTAAVMVGCREPKTVTRWSVSISRAVTK